MPFSLLPQSFVMYIISTIICLTYFSEAYKQCLDEQQTLLLELKNNLTFDSAVSRKLVKWDEMDDCCEWEGVECDASGHVITLQLGHDGISGGLQNSSSILVSLEYLEKLNLAYNSLNGSIPWSLFNHPSLKQLILSNNKFRGQLHEFPIPKSCNLVELNLSSNQLEGPLPDSFFNLQSLEVLSLSYNLFNGTLHLKKIKSLHNLTLLDLSHNNLYVDTSSSELNLSGNFQLNKLSLASCNLQTFPDIIKQLNLSFLDLSYNQITGEIPSWIWEIGNGKLYHVDLSHNLLVGLQEPYHIPSFVSELDLSSNLLRGELPLLPRGASYVDFSNNNFEGPIPSDFVSSNFFLIFLSIANNTISGSIPTCICSASTIQVLDLSLNNLSGSIPPCIVESMPNLLGLNLRENNISGVVPDKFSSSCGVRYLDLSNNILGGKFPESLGNCKSVELVNVGENKIGGRFPCMLASRLKVLVVRSNRLEGEVKCGENWPNLQIMDVSCNNLSGDLQHISFSRWKKMVRHGPESFIPRRLDINVLRPDLYYSTRVSVTLKGVKLQFSRTLSILRLIDLSSNNFHGEIPDAIGGLSSLHALNLSHNALTGVIPKSLGNMLGLETLDLSLNQLSGDMPEELTRLSSLSRFTVSYNKLFGKIPSDSHFEIFTEDSFVGNPDLCGQPSSNNCSSDGNHSFSSPTESAAVPTILILIPMLLHISYIL